MIRAVIIGEDRREGQWRTVGSLNEKSVYKYELVTDHILLGQIWAAQTWMEQNCLQNCLISNQD